MELIINHIKINPDAESILKLIRRETGSRYFSIIEKKGSDVLCQCPMHKDGKENTPACNVFNSSKNEDIEFGTYHCFACGAKGRLRSLVSFCLGISGEDADDWLVDNFGISYVDEIAAIDKFEFGTRRKKNHINESILETFDYDNDTAFKYLVNKRHLSKEVIDYFHIGYNVETSSITFPCRDLSGNLVGVFERNIMSKFFKIPKISPKPTYLLYETVKLGYTFVYVCESQINALTMWGWGYPAIALFGTGSKSQYEDLKKSGVKMFCCVFDGDKAGKEGLSKFVKNMGCDTMIFYKIVPDGKDVNDLRKDEFDELPMYSTC